MIRILLSLAVAGAAFFGPWFAELSTGSFSGTQEVVQAGEYYAGNTVSCLSEGRISVSGECAPDTGLAGWFVSAAVLLGLASAALNVLGLLPLVGRFTSLFAIAAGIAGVGALVSVALALMGADTATLGDLRWGAYATGGFGLLCGLAGMAGLNGDRD